jgi:MinD-like ATPase involved in chromosome partitioning or flagellar assembly
VTLLFREVLPAVHRVLVGRAVSLRDVPTTVVVDVSGRVRVLLLVAVGKKHDDPVRLGMRELEAALGAEIGPWLASPDPVVAANDVPKSVVEVAREAGRPWPIEGAPGELYLLDRVVARHGWVGDLDWSPPWPLSEVDAGEAPPVWVFYSQKGGVGRTTAVAAVASYLARRGLRVLAVDLDVEAPGLGDLLLGSGSGAAGVLDLLTGVDEALEDRVGGAVRAVVEHALSGEGKLFVLPAGQVDRDYLRMLARLDLQGSADARAALDRLSQVLRLARAHVRPDVVLLDARAGFHDVGGLALAGLAHAVVFLGRAEEPTWQGLESVARILSTHRGEDDEAAVWLQVVHAHAPADVDPRAAPADYQEALLFQDLSLKALTESGYFRDPPDARDEASPHFPFPIRLEPRLRASGGLLRASQLVVLDELHAPLARRLVSRFPGLRAQFPELL